MKCELPCDIISANSLTNSIFSLYPPIIVILRTVRVFTVERKCRLFHHLSHASLCRGRLYDKTFSYWMHWQIDIIELVTHFRQPISGAFPVPDHLLQGI